MKYITHLVMNASMMYGVRWSALAIKNEVGNILQWYVFDRFGMPGLSVRRISVPAQGRTGVSWTCASQQEQRK